MTKAAVVIAVDDTDNAEQGGTGQVARTIAGRLAGRFPVWGVTRHQFIVLPEIPYTKKNSGNAVHLLEAPGDLAGLAEEVAEWVRELVQPGSDPGLCVARPEALQGVELGREAQRRFVAKDEAWAAARAAGALLGHPCETDDGIVGALAGACLAAGGDDGRFVQVGRVRDLTGEVTVGDFLAAGGDEVRSVEGEVVHEGVVRAERLRPALRGGRCVLYCARSAEGVWLPLSGGPDDEQSGGARRGEQ